MKAKIKTLLYSLLYLFYRDLNKYDGLYSIKTLYKYAFMQKILGFNRSIPWPVHFTSKVKCPEKIKRGTKYPGFAVGEYIDGRCGIIFEENVWTGPKVSIISQNHNLSDFTQYVDANPIRIGKNSWLANGCIILPGIELGEHTVVAAAAVVTKSFPEGNQLIGGNPAKLIRKLDLYDKNLVSE